MSCTDSGDLWFMSGIFAEWGSHGPTIGWNLVPLPEEINRLSAGATKLILKPAFWKSDCHIWFLISTDGNPSLAA
jgi:hypothetical protein